MLLAELLLVSRCVVLRPAVVVGRIRRLFTVGRDITVKETALGR